MTSDIPSRAQVADAFKQGVAQVKTTVTKDARELQAGAEHIRDQTLCLLKDPQFQTCTIATSCGAIVMGGLGGAFGTVSGIVVGGAAGVVPSLLTFGLSIPTGAAIGGGAGLCSGTLVGGSVGGLTGCVLYKYRLEIKKGVLLVRVKSVETATDANVKVVAAGKASKRLAYSAAARAEAKTKRCIRATKAAGRETRTKFLTLVDATRTKMDEFVVVATSTKAGATSAGALTGGAVGGTAGSVVGTLAGATVGVVPALFTAGLSIPVCAAVGLCAGTTVGGATGVVAGGAAGYGGFMYANDIKDTARTAWTTASTSASYVRAKAEEKAAQAKASARAWVGRSETGGTA